MPQSAHGRDDDTTEPVPACPVVGVGASAGGLEAFTQLLQSLPDTPGLAFVLIQHLDPTHESFLSEVLVRATKMPIAQIRDGTPVHPNHVYVIPPNTDVGISKGVLSLGPRQVDVRGPAHAVDHFFRSLAADMGHRAIGMVLSGTGADGTEGLRAIKAENGVSLAQTPRTAKFGGMPSSAIDAGVVDLAASIPELAQVLVRLGHHPYLLEPARDLAQLGGPTDGPILRKLLLLLRAASGVDFSDYKPATIKRRLARRMAVREAASLREYWELLEGDSNEVQALFEDMLVGVTSFFRDPEVFEQLKSTILPEVIARRPEGGLIRVWVPGCSSGEEAYSIAICLIELLGDRLAKYTVQIFASDISKVAIDRARAGFYSDNAVRPISPERLQAFFNRVERGYTINKIVRDMCVFVRHNLIGDPPFSKLDLLSCRNVLIYLSARLQSQLISMFHFALNPSGFLLLGRSESLTDSHHLFSVVDPETKIFARSSSAPPLAIAPFPQLRTPLLQAFPSAQIARSSSDIINQAESLLLAHYAPAGVVIDANGDVIQFRGNTGAYLEPPPGRPQYNLLKMARPGLLADLRLTLNEAKSTRKPARRADVQIEQDGTVRSFELAVYPLPEPSAGSDRDRAFVVTFEGPTQRQLRTAEASELAAADAGVIDPARIGKELQATKEHLHASIVEQQKVNEELGSANEELLSYNEELQSLNEELETAKEELQSTNEELISLNTELDSRNSLLQRANADLSNLLNSVELPVVIVDGDRKIRRFTTSACPVLNLRPGDEGRPIHNIRTDLEIDLDHEISAVLEKIEASQQDVQDHAGRWHRVQIRPYMTGDKKIDGAVVSIMDIDLLKRALNAAEWARDYAVGIVEAFRVPILVLDDTLCVVSANKAFYETFAVSKAATVGTPLFELGRGHWDAEPLHTRLDTMLTTGAPFEPFEYTCDPEGLGQRIWLLAAEPVPSFAGMSMVLLTIEDITHRKRHEAERNHLLAATEEARVLGEEANAAKDLFLATVSHELRTPLSSILLQAQLLNRLKPTGEKLTKGLLAIERAAKIQAQLIDDLLDISRIVTGKLMVELQMVKLPDILHNAVDIVRPLAEQSSITIEETIAEDIPPISGDMKRLQQVVWNLLTNAVKFTPEGGRVRLVLDRVDASARIRVIDTGVGIDPEYQSKIFTQFSQADLSQTRARGGLGLGLAISQHIVRIHGGNIQASSPGKGHGSTFTVTLPLLTWASAPGTRAEGAPALHEPLAGVKVLIVEDNPATREALLQMLSLVGAEVREAESARRALELFEQFQPQLLISDIAMPDEDGYSLLAKIRARGPEAGGDIPAVALTALAAEEDRKRAAAGGFQQYLTKPIDMDRLVQALVQLLPKTEPPPEPPSSTSD